MYFISEKFNTAAQAKARHLLVKALFNGTVELTGSNLIDMTVTEALNTSDGLSMGSTISSKLTLSLRMPESPLLLDGGWVEPWVGYYGIEEYCPLGKFYITKVESKDDFVTATIEAYDAFSKTEIPYTPEIAMPNSAEAILGDIAAQCGFSIIGTSTHIENSVLISADIPSSSEGILIYSKTPSVNNAGLLLFDDVAYPEGQFDLFDFTCRQYIGYFAGLLGKNARFNREGKLAFEWYSNTNYIISADLQYMSGLKKLTESDIVVQSISSGTSDNVLVAGAGAGFSFENPFMTQNILNNILSNTGSIKYTPAQLKWRGNPSLEAGDIIFAEDKNGAFCTLYVMEQTLKIGGGLQSEIKCFGKSDADIKFDTSPTAKKLQQVYTKLQDTIKEAATLLNGANGGVFEVLDGNGDGINDGWIIHSADKSQFIKATVDGIGITTDGGATYKEAITTKGINASTITTGSLNAERIAVENYDEDDPAKLTDYIRFEEGTITLGKGDSAIILKLENDRIAFYPAGSDKPLGLFTNNAFEIQNLKDGKIKFQNFGFVTRDSGNLSFTLLE